MSAWRRGAVALALLLPACVYLPPDRAYTGPLPLTDRVHVLAHGTETSETALSDQVVRHTLPVEQLARINVVDTPGTNSPLKRHQEITESFLPRAIG